MRSSLAFSDEKASLNEILLKAKVFLHKIGKKELAEWVKPSFERQTGNWFTKLLGRAAKGGVGPDGGGRGRGVGEAAMGRGPQPQTTLHECAGMGKVWSPDRQNLRSVAPFSFHLWVRSFPKISLFKDLRPAGPRFFRQRPSLPKTPVGYPARAARAENAPRQRQELFSRCAPGNKTNRSAKTSAALDP